MSATNSASGSAMDARGGRFVPRLPITRLGRVSMWLALGFLVGFTINTMMVPIVGTSTNPAVNEFSRTYLPYWSITLLASGFIAGAIGLVAMLRDKERSIITLLTLVPMLFVTVFMLGEFLLPH